MPKVFERDDGKLVGWEVTFARQDHLKLWESSSGTPCVVVCPEKLYEDLCEAIESYAADFDDSARVKQLTQRFADGFLTMGRVFQASDVGALLAPEVERGLQRTKKM